MNDAGRLHALGLDTELRGAGFTDAEREVFFAAMDKDPGDLTAAEVDLLGRHYDYRTWQLPGVA